MLDFQPLEHSACFSKLFPFPTLVSLLHKIINEIHRIINEIHRFINEIHRSKPKPTSVASEKVVGI